MGRRAVAVAEQERWVFNRLAEDYLQRPEYPPALVARLLALAGGAPARVADLGAGVGHLALPLALAGAEVLAVEPAREMLRALQARAGRAPVVPIHAAAEDTGIPGGTCALVLVADALQWMDPGRAGREAARILAPGGAVAVVEARLARSRFLDALSELVVEANPRARPSPPGRLRHFLALSAGRPPISERFTHVERIERVRLDAVLRSLSTVGPALAPARLADLLGRARELAAAHGGVVWSREITLHWARARRG
jgi:SAM-dependent methyltransferase